MEPTAEQRAEIAAEMLEMERRGYVRIYVENGTEMIELTDKGRAVLVDHNDE